MPPCRHTVNCGFGNAPNTDGAMALRNRRFVSDTSRKRKSEVWEVAIDWGVRRALFVSSK